MAGTSVENEANRGALFEPRHPRIRALGPSPRRAGCPGRESNPLKTDLQSVTLAALSPGRSGAQTLSRYSKFRSARHKPLPCAGGSIRRSPMRAPSAALVAVLIVAGLPLVVLPPPRGPE